MNMEYIWYFIAALGAGVGTGLAGLSAATVMVPILIVLCPSFYGETGAYHATAIALASDILGSAVTSAIYIRHKNIDLKRGAIMMVCIICMCIAGSFAAWSAGNVVLGSFSLILCVGIGIRFLVKPDTQKDKTVAKGAALEWKGIAISLFFGLTIGFGTGFVGTGGGMMMLVVFTAFLGMERRSAVGTSTFIMTFTALIAFVSHALIDPEIVLERWDVLIICIVTATAASIVSARFANRVNAKTVGLVTGAILTVLGVLMLILNYREQISRCEIIWDMCVCMGKYLVYLAICVTILLLDRAFLHPNPEVFRKSLHIVAYTSSIFMMYISGEWLVPCLCCLLFAAIVYPVLHLAEKLWNGYDSLFVQRHKGEIKVSLLLLFCTHAVLIAVFWGWIGKLWIVVTSILIWGLGDTMAALIGKRYGKHHVKLPLADHKKTWEGSFAMAAAGVIVGTIAMLVTSSYPWYLCIVMSLIAAVAAAYVEMISHNGDDTASVPAATAIVLALISLVL